MVIKNKNLDSKTIIRKIEENKKSLQKWGVKKIGLFGSFLNGKPTKRSDIDVLIVLEKPGFDNYIELKLMLERMFKRKIDLVIEEDLRPELKYVRKEAKYARL
ncbi:nucleotidyltransferase domain-containing protein [Candidatus Pacearchaeota archaeon]|nr:nucleotidyltransferase domain-containing protein [Candidatus Pacearchaeota archaeon]